MATRKRCKTYGTIQASFTRSFISLLQQDTQYGRAVGRVPCASARPYAQLSRLVLQGLGAPLLCQKQYLKQSNTEDNQPPAPQLQANKTYVHTAPHLSTRPPRRALVSKPKTRRTARRARNSNTGAPVDTGTSQHTKQQQTQNKHNSSTRLSATNDSGMRTTRRVVQPPQGRAAGAATGAGRVR